MNLTDDQIVRFLIDKYKQEGKDLSFLLSDPVFAQLPLGSKVEALKKYAAELVAGSNTGMNRNDWKSIGKTTAVSAMVGALGANKFVNSKTIQDLAASKGLNLGGVSNLLSRKGFLTAATMGALGGLAYSGINVAEALSARRKVKSNLEQLANNPTDRQGIYTLVNHSKLPSTGIRSDSLADKLKSKINAFAQQHARDQAVKMINNDVNIILSRAKNSQQG